MCAVRYVFRGSKKLEIRFDECDIPASPNPTDYLDKTYGSDKQVLDLILEFATFNFRLEEHLDPYLVDIVNRIANYFKNKADSSYKPIPLLEPKKSDGFGFLNHQNPATRLFHSESSMDDFEDFLNGLPSVFNDAPYQRQMRIKDCQIENFRFDCLTYVRDFQNFREHLEKKIKQYLHGINKFGAILSSEQKLALDNSFKQLLEHFPQLANYHIFQDQISVLNSTDGNGDLEILYIKLHYEHLKCKHQYYYFRSMSAMSLILT